MRSSARDIAPAGRDTDTGFGLLDLPAALTKRPPAPDPQEPNDDVHHVRAGGLFRQPTAGLTRPGRGRAALTARLDETEDPEDVYRIWIPRRRTLVATLQANANVQLAAWGPKTTTVFERGAALRRDLVATSFRRGTAREVVRVENTRRRGAYLYLDAFLGAQRAARDLQALAHNPALTHGPLGSRGASVKRVLGPIVVVLALAAPPSAGSGYVGRGRAARPRRPRPRAGRPRARRRRPARWALLTHGGERLSPDLELWRLRSSVARRLVPRLAAQRLVRVGGPGPPLPAADDRVPARAALPQPVVVPARRRRSRRRRRGPGRPVTVVDTGVDLAHPEFRGRPDTRRPERDHVQRRRPRLARHRRRLAGRGAGQRRGPRRHLPAGEAPGLGRLRPQLRRRDRRPRRRVEERARRDQPQPRLPGRGVRRRSARSGRRRRQRRRSAGARWSSQQPGTAASTAARSSSRPASPTC